MVCCPQVRMKRVKVGVTMFGYESETWSYYVWLCYMLGLIAVLAP